MKRAFLSDQAHAVVGGPSANGREGGSEKCEWDVVGVGAEAGFGLIDFRAF